MVVRKIMEHAFYWLIKKPFFKLFASAFLSIPLKFCKQTNLRTEKIKDDMIDIVVISFNNEKVINTQIESLKKYFKDEFLLTIADNSSINAKAKEIRKICIQKNIGYVKIPKQKYFKVSASHGIALNWVYRHLIKKRRAEYFGFLDHDLFPVANISIKKILEGQHYYGLRHYGINSANKNVWDTNTPKYWYLWAGLCFFKTNWLKNKTVDFNYCFIDKTFLDTGGGNWASMYSKDNVQNYRFPTWERVRIGQGNVRQANYIDFIENSWVHTINGSDWYETKEEEKNIEQILNRFEIQCKTEKFGD